MWCGCVEGSRSASGLVEGSIKQLPQREAQANRSPLEGGACGAASGVGGVGQRTRVGSVLDKKVNDSKIERGTPPGPRRPPRTSTTARSCSKGWTSWSSCSRHGTSASRSPTSGTTPRKSGAEAMSFENLLGPSLMKTCPQLRRVGSADPLLLGAVRAV